MSNDFQACHRSSMLGLYHCARSMCAMLQMLFITRNLEGSFSESIGSTCFSDFCASAIQFTRWTLLKERFSFSPCVRAISKLEPRAGILERSVEARVYSFERNERARSCKRWDCQRRIFSPAVQRFFLPSLTYFCN